MTVKLFESELKVMELLWKEGDLPAKEIAQQLKEQVQWSKTTTYTVLKKCVEKQAVLRTDPGFLCRPLVSRQEVQKAATEDLIDRMYGGSKDLLIASLLGNQDLTPEEIARLKKLAEEWK
ncbi:MAG: BlaI/MecI/CopY family transcriptional regulator [Eubacterium sp.]|nr:BlaI/MecI/CopY family transcriptional regulator [Eubacterium sp.]MDE7312932.1 BlaI/MecI/CopY family transcriptional regulator [Eubacterium sp.]